MAVPLVLVVISWMSVAGPYEIEMQEFSSEANCNAAKAGLLSEAEKISSPDNPPEDSI
jgi:hypothetical protein